MERRFRGLKEKEFKDMEKVVRKIQRRAAEKYNKVVSMDVIIKTRYYARI